MAHLVFQTAFPGDLFLAIPLLKRIREWDPESSLTLACRPGLGDFFLRSGLVNEVIEVDKRSAAGRHRSLARLRAQVWDVVFVPHESFRTALWMARVRAKQKIGFRKWWNFPIYTQRVARPIDYPDALRQLSLLAPLDPSLAEKFGGAELQDLRSPHNQSSPLDLAVPPIPEWASMGLQAGKPAGRIIFLAPGSVWATKRWTRQGYQALAQLLVQRGYQVVLVGSGQEKELCQAIAGEVPGVINRAGQTSLAELVELFSTGMALVCNDSGAMHAAAIVGLPTVAIFGPTTLAQGFRPWQNRAVVVQRTLGCRPCGKHGSEHCPIGTHECMEKIAPGDVLAALEKLLRTGSPSC